MFFLSQVFLTYWCLDRLYTILDLKAAKAVVIQKGRNIITGVLKQKSVLCQDYSLFPLTVPTWLCDLLIGLVGEGAGDIPYYCSCGCFLPCNRFNPAASCLLSPFYLPYVAVSSPCRLS